MEAGCRTAKGQLSETDGWAFRRPKESLLTKFASLRVAPDSEVYNMRHKRRGVALIFNNINFKNMATRRGTVKDCADLKVALSRLGFEIRVYTDPGLDTVSSVLRSRDSGAQRVNFDLNDHEVKIESDTQTTRVKMTRLPLSEAAAEDHTDADCLLVAVMSHGESGLVHSSDALYPVDMLWSPFTGDRCYTLAGKPKLFFIQACRGAMLDKGVKIIHETDGRNSYSIPAYADIMVAYSTYDGFYSWRNPDAGSWFIQAICEELNLHGQKRDLLTLMTFVNRRVAIQYQSYVPQNLEFHSKKQIPSVVTMLTRLVYFEPKPETLQEKQDRALDNAENGKRTSIQ